MAGAGAGGVTDAPPWRVAVITVVPEVAAGYPELLRALGHEPVVVIGARRRRPGDSTTASAGELALAAPEGVDVVLPDTRGSLARVLEAYEVDLGLCTGYPWLIPAEAIAVPRLGIVNGHPSLLPRYRGPFPVAWAVRNGETEIGLTYHLMDAAFDTGNVLAQMPVPLHEDDDSESLFGRFPGYAAELLPQALGCLARGEVGDPQEGGDYYSRFGDDYVHVDVAGPAADVHRQVRAWSFMPFGRVGPILDRGGERIRILRSSLAEVEGAERLDCADAPLWILESEPA